MPKRVVIVTGSRSLGDSALVGRCLAELKPDLVVEGGARGADAIAREWALTHDVTPVTVHALWLGRGRGAGHYRNALMLELFPGATVLAFPRGGPGTANCIAQALKLGMRVVER